MSPRPRCDDVLRLIHETLREHPTRSGDDAASRAPCRPVGRQGTVAIGSQRRVETWNSAEAVGCSSSDISDPDAIRREPETHAPQITRVFVVDDHEIVRRGVRELLNAEADLTVVGEADAAGEALSRISLTQPDVVIMDVWIPDHAALEACRAIRQRWPATLLLILTSAVDDRIGPFAVAGGVAACIPRDASANDFVDRVRRASRLGMLARVTCPPIAAIHGPKRVDDLRDLTSRERRVLDLVGEGLTNRQIGVRMHLAEKTVKNYVSNLLMKLGMRRRTEAVALIARLDERRRLVGA